MDFLLARTIVGALVLSLCAASSIAASAADSVPTARSVKEYGAVGDGLQDDTEAIQKCIDAGYDGVWHNCVRILFPAGTYRVTHQIVVWAGVHLECDPQKPATILLPANTPGYGDPRLLKPVFMSRLSAARPDKHNPKPFPEDIIYYYKVGNRPLPGWPWKWPDDYDSAQYDQHTVCPGCGPGNNFWSQIRNLHFRVEPGNPGACVIHYNNAQGSALYNLQFDLADDTFCAIAGGPGTTGCIIRGGRYGLYDICELGKIMDCRFIGQKEACYYAPSGSSRLWVGCTFEGAPVALKHKNPWRLTMVDCEVRNCTLGVEVPIPNSLLFIQNLKAFRTPVLFRSNERTIPGSPKGDALLPVYASGLVYVDGKKLSGGLIDTRASLPRWNSVPSFTDISKGANVKTLGAIGDGKADDTAAIRKAIEAADTVYLPAGSYRVTDTLMLKPKTRLIGVHASAATIFIENNTPGFMDAAHARPMIDTPDAADAEVHISQLTIAGLNAYSGSGGNTGAIAIRWRVGRKSSISWINFNAHTSLLVTGNGGGSIFDSWTASHGLYRGVVIDHNQEPLMVYGLSTEHQTDKALSMTGAKNVTFYCGGFGEGNYPTDKVMNEIVDCDNIAMIFTVIHPAPDEYTAAMTGFRIKNTPNILIAPFYRIHEEPMKHTVIDARPDGTTSDLGNNSFALYKWGNIGDGKTSGQGGGSSVQWLNPRRWFGGGNARGASSAGSAAAVAASPLPARLSSVWQVETQTEGRRCDLFWKRPSAPDLKGVRVVRKQNGFPAGPRDGELIYRGRASRCEDILPSGVQAAGYAIFLEDLSGRLSRGSTAYAVLDRGPATAAESARVAPAALEKGLRYHWDFSQAAVGKDGTVSADTAGKTIGTLSGGAALRPAPFCPPGVNRLALALPARFMNCGLALAAQDVAGLKGSLTLSGWFWVKDESCPAFIMGNYPGGTFQPGIFHLDRDRFEAADETGRGFQLVGLQQARWAPGEWTHLLATLTPKQARVYVNGLLVAKQNIDFSPESTWLSSRYPFKLGGINAGDLPQSGIEVVPERFLNHVRIYDRALSEQEIGALYWMEVEQL